MEFENVIGLEELDLGQNGITAFPSVDKLPVFIRYLDVSNNLITSMPVSIPRLCQLEYLKI